MGAEGGIEQNSCDSGWYGYFRFYILHFTFIFKFFLMKYRIYILPGTVTSYRVVEQTTQTTQTHQTHPRQAHFSLPPKTFGWDQSTSSLLHSVAVRNCADERTLAIDALPILADHPFSNILVSDLISDPQHYVYYWRFTPIRHVPGSCLQAGITRSLRPGSSVSKWKQENYCLHFFLVSSIDSDLQGNS